jgi:hypothetical protein
MSAGREQPCGTTGSHSEEEMYSHVRRNSRVFLWDTDKASAALCLFD